MRAVRGGGLRRAGGSRERHELFLGSVAGLGRGIVTQRALGARRKTKLRRELPEAAGDARELVGNRVRPPEIVSAWTLCKSTKANEEGAIRIEQAREMWLVEPGGVLFDFPHDSPDALVALADGAARGSRPSWSQFGRGAHDFTAGSVAGAPFCCWRRASRRALGLGLVLAPRLQHFA
jgi:hypothetical protein